MGRWQFRTLVLSRRRSMPRLRLASCWRILVHSKSLGAWTGCWSAQTMKPRKTPRDFDFFRILARPEAETSLVLGLVGGGVDEDHFPLIGLTAGDGEAQPVGVERHRRHLAEARA